MAPSENAPRSERERKKTGIQERRPRSHATEPSKGSGEENKRTRVCKRSGQGKRTRSEGRGHGKNAGT